MHAWRARYGAKDRYFGTSVPKCLSAGSHIREYEEGDPIRRGPFRVPKVGVSPEPVLNRSESLCIHT